MVSSTTGRKAQISSKSNSIEIGDDGFSGEGGSCFERLDEEEDGAILVSVDCDKELRLEAVAAICPAAEEEPDNEETGEGVDEVCCDGPKTNFGSQSLPINIRLPTGPQTLRERLSQKARGKTQQCYVRPGVPCNIQKFNQLEGGMRWP